MSIKTINDRLFEKADREVSQRLDDKINPLLEGVARSWSVPGLYNKTGQEMSLDTALSHIKATLMSWLVPTARQKMVDEYLAKIEKMEQELEQLKDIR